MIDRRDRPDPWRSPVTLAQIPDRGLHRELDADEAQRKAMAEVAGLRDVLSAHASFDVTPKSGGRFHVSGKVRARVGQTCVVTLDPIENEIDEPIDLIFAPPEQVPQMAALVDEAVESDGETPDPPEPIEGGGKTTAAVAPVRAANRSSHLISCTRDWPAPTFMSAGSPFWKTIIVGMARTL